MKTTTFTKRLNPSRRRAATLVEVVTGAATVTVLVAAVFAPAFSGLRERQGRAICTARIAQITQALLVYAQDYDEVPPFTGLGWENIVFDSEPSDNPASTAAGPGDIPTRSRWEWAVSETWISQDPQLLWNGTLPEQDWPNYGVGVTTGTLYTYTRYDNLYRCPEFERIAGKSQSQFNYTRTLMGRKWILSPLSDSGQEPDYWGASDFGAVGQIVSVDQVHRPDLLPMLYDEWWLRHVGSPIDQHIPIRSAEISGGWCAVDPMHFPLADEIGRYHGRPVRSEWFPPGSTTDARPLQQGNVACYDGHVELRRTPFASLSDWNMGQIVSALGGVINHLNYLIYAQRGVTISGAPL